MDNEKMKRIDELLESVNAGSFFSLKTLTTFGYIKMNGKISKSSETELKVTKKASFVTQSSTNYEKRAQAKAINKGEVFTIDRPLYGERISRNLVTHKGQLYLQVIHDPDSNLKKPDVQYFVNGKEVGHQIVIEKYKGEPRKYLQLLSDGEPITHQLMPKPTKSGIEPRNLKSESILEITVAGQTIAA